MHTPLILTDISLSLSHKTCFEDFSTHIYPGSRIGIIGRNGSGKSSLLNILRQHTPPSSGHMSLPDDLCIGYVEQTIHDFHDLSGGQRLNKRLSEALAQLPDLLLLDEPTNHLDQNNRKSLLKMLSRYEGTLIIVSHDTDLLRTCIDTLWHIEPAYAQGFGGHGNNRIHEFTGSYDDYLREIQQKRAFIEKELASLKRDKKDTHTDLMKEQKRAAKSNAKCKKSIEQRKWPTVVSKSKALKAEQTSGKKKSAIDKKKQHLTDQLSDLYLPDIITPTFSLSAQTTGSGTCVSITDGSVAYANTPPLCTDITLSLSTTHRLHITGANGSGKSTLLKAILGDHAVITTGHWHKPQPAHIGYVDQHYSGLHPTLSAIDHIKDTRPDWSDHDGRRHLNDFLFRKNEDVNQLSRHLSGGEKARLCLALIAAQTPRLLILDEITNNLDLETKNHVTQVLQNYPGAMIIVSHDHDFVQAVGVDHVYKII
jgi:ATPase subunit of ABC transporter with duplicated ATPase domains